MPRIMSEDELAAHQARFGRSHDRWKEREARVGLPHSREADVQSAVLELLRVHPRVAWAHRFNTGGVERRNADGSTRYIAFAFSGCPDILGQLKGGRLLAIECKSSTGRVTTEQFEFLWLAARHGALAIVARSVDDVVAALAET